MLGRWAGALERPNGITRYPKWPYLVRNAGLPFVTRLDSDPVVSILQVQLSEEFTALESIQCLGD